MAATTALVRRLVVGTLSAGALTAGVFAGTPGALADPPNCTVAVAVAPEAMAPSDKGKPAALVVPILAVVNCTFAAAVPPVLETFIAMTIWLFGASRVSVFVIKICAGVPLVGPLTLIVTLFETVW